MDTKPPILVRDARPEELPAIAALTTEAYSEYASLMAPTAWAGLDAAVKNALASPLPVDRLVAIQDSNLVGSVMLFPANIGAYGSMAGQITVPELRMLAVHRRARGHGIGRMLVEACVERARRTGAQILGLHTSISMQAAIHLYESMGFTRYPEDDFQPEGAELIMAYRLAIPAPHPG